MPGLFHSPSLSIKTQLKFQIKPMPITYDKEKFCWSRTYFQRFLQIVVRTFLLVLACSVPASLALATEEPLTHTRETNRPLVDKGATQTTQAVADDVTGQPIVQKNAKESHKKKEALSIEETCIKIGAKLGSVNKEDCMTSGFELTGSRSVNGIPILVREFPPLPDRNSSGKMRKPQARVLLIGGVHGDEYSSVSIIFKWIKTLIRHHSGMFHWRVAPLINPDGLLQKKSNRVNAHGVDLNRNFPTRDWKDDSTDYWVRRTGRDPRRYPGQMPLSEPESQWVVDEIEQFQPNVIISVHAPFGLLDFDGPPTIPPERLGNIYLSLLGTYPGSLGRYAGENLKIPIITIELPHAGILPTKKQSDRIWVDLVRWLRMHVRDRTAMKGVSPP